MEDRELYRRILGIEGPWYVASVDLQLEPQQVHVYLAHEDIPSWPCAECAAPSPLYDHQPERQWRHLDTCQYRTILHADPPRSQCSTHGVRVVKLLWGDAQDWRAFAALRRSELKTARAWALKETAMSLYNYTYEGSARKYFQWWHSWAVRSRLRPMVQVAVC